MRPTHRLAVRVRSYETDPNGRLQAPILCRYLQEAATIHAAQLGVSVGALVADGVAWVLTRLRLTMDRWPGAEDEIVIRTWPEASNRLITERRFEIRDVADEVLGSALTLWLVMDLEKRRPIRLPSTVVEALSRHDLAGRPTRLPEIETAGSLDHEASFTVRRSDLDLAGHVNNTSYVEWALEAVPDALWACHELARLDISYLTECRRGSSVRSGSRIVEVDRGFESLHRLVRSDDDEVAARARAVWRSVPPTEV
jgi:acyl-ACP thioesterase